MSQDQLSQPPFHPAGCCPCRSGQELDCAFQLNDRKIRSKRSTLIYTRAQPMVTSWISGVRPPDPFTPAATFSALRSGGKYGVTQGACCLLGDDSARHCVKKRLCACIIHILAKNFLCVEPKMTHYLSFCACVLGGVSLCPCLHVSCLVCFSWSCARLGIRLLTFLPDNFEQRRFDGAVLSTREDKRPSQSFPG